MEKIASKLKLYMSLLLSSTYYANQKKTHTKKIMPIKKK